MISFLSMIYRLKSCFNGQFGVHKKKKELQYSIMSLARKNV